MTTATQTETVETTARNRLQPHVDVYESADDLLLIMDVPGASKKDVDIRFHKNLLTIEAPVDDDRAYVRTFGLPKGLDVAGFTAELDKGVLSLRLPRAEEAKPHRIEIS